MSDAKGRFWLCQNCGKHVPARQTECRCGFSRAELPEVAFKVVGGLAPSSEVGPAWFAVGPAKLVAMSIVTLGLYQVYWFYQQWRRVRDSGEDVWPVPRSIFGGLYAYPLFRRVVRSAGDIGASTGPGVLAVVYLLLCLSARLPLPFGLIALLSALPLAAIQRVANAVAERDFPDVDPNRRLTTANWIGVAAAGVLLAFAARGALLRERPASLSSLSRIAAEVNRTPRTPTDGIVLDRADALEGTLIYYFSVDDQARMRLEERRPRLKELIVPSLCRGPLLKNGVSVRFVYNDQTGQEIAAVDAAPRDCGS